MQSLLLVGVGGFLGAIARYGMALLCRGASGEFPWSTLLVNVIGSLAIGLIYGYVREHPSIDAIRLFAMTGFLGAFTTFSAFSFETIQLLQSGAIRVALLNIGANLLTCLLATAGGLWVSSR